VGCQPELNQLATVTACGHAQPNAAHLGASDAPVVGGPAGVPAMLACSVSRPRSRGLSSITRPHSMPSRTLNTASVHQQQARPASKTAWRVLVRRAAEYSVGGVWGGNTMIITAAKGVIDPYRVNSLLGDVHAQVSLDPH
jgi:hypothetical protein